jgi:hypothetical protein
LSVRRAAIFPSATGKIAGKIKISRGDFHPNFCDLHFSINGLRISERRGHGRNNREKIGWNREITGEMRSGELLTSQG